MLMKEEIVKSDAQGRPLVLLLPKVICGNLN